jgi:hypothetical protein
MIKEFKNGNVARIEGILSENGLKDISYEKDGKQVEAIGGSIKVRVETQINKEDVVLEVPVTVFAKKLKNDGTPNGIYTSLKTVKDTFLSIASVGIEKADRVRITSGSITMNELWLKDGTFSSTPQISTNFINRVSKDDCKPDATFSLTFMVGKIINETDKEGIETGRLKITAVVPKYGEKVDVVPLIAANPGVVEAISQYWNEGDTVVAQGKLNFSHTVEKQKVTENLGFGETIERTISNTTKVAELLVTGGNPEPLAEEFALNADEVKVALAARQVYINSLKDKKTNAKPASKAPKGASSSTIDLGF